MKKTLAERFWEKVNKDGPVPKHCPELGPCWVWVASLDKRNYGQFGAWAIRKSPMRAHRVAWFLTHGIFPDQSLLHKCDNPRCVNPDHVYPGTDKQNTQDAISRNRPVITYPGERNPQSKLTNELVLQIRYIAAMENAPTHTTIARWFNISRRCVGFIITRQRWRHI